MQAYRLKTKIPENNALQLHFVTLPPGEVVEIIILTSEHTPHQTNVITVEPVPEVLIAETARQSSLVAIQSGKYTSPSQPGKPLASDVFAAQKAEEKEQEERRWQA